MSFLRYAKSGHRAKHVQKVQSPPRKKRSLLWGLTAIALVGSAGVALATGSDESEEREPLSTEDVIERAERLHRQALVKKGLLPESELVDEETSVDPALASDAVESQAAPEEPVTLADASGAMGEAAAVVSDAALSAASEPAAAAAEKVEEVVVSVTDRVRRGETLTVALTRHGVSMDAVNRLVVGLKGVLDARTIRPGDAYTIAETVAVPSVDAAPDKPSKMARFEFRPRSFLGGPTKVVAELVEPDEDDADPRYEARKEVTPIETKVVAVSGDIGSSLYVSLTDKGEGSALVNAMADVFAWNIDFYRETRKGDTYKVIVEKQYADGRFIGYGKVLAAEYVNAGEVHRGYNFTSGDEQVRGIFDDKGESLERTFLKSPMEVTRLTSSYGQRFHPVLKRWKRHNGIDYGAARGTPYWAVADGVVKEARYSRSAGKMIVLRHAQGYETEYFHSSRFAKGLKVGMKVKQRQVIGYVGSTGRSTGPHLHFGMRKNGRYVDPKKQKFPSAKPVPDAYLEEYVKAIAPLRAELESLEIS